MKQEDIVTFYGQIRISNVKPNDPQSGGLSHFHINTKYVNNTRKVIRAKLRSNLEMTIPAVAVRTQYSHDETFLVRKELVVSQVCIEAMRSYFANLPEVYGELEMFRRAYLQVYDNVFVFGQTRELRCIVEYLFTETDLTSNGGMFYHDGLDTMFKFGDEPYPCDHPHSPQGREHAIKETAEDLQKQHGFVFWVEIIDNLGKYGERFVSICNQIYKIVPKRDKNRPDGLYIVSSNPSNGRVSTSEIQVRTYPLDNIDKELGIYATYELAKSHGDVAGERKKEMQDRDHAFAKEKQDWSREKLHFEREADEKDRHIRDLEQDRALHAQLMKDLRDRQEHLTKMQKLQMDDNYEQRSAERKDASEFIKFLPSILAAVGTVIMIWKSFKSGS
jgi:hypothetical protein